MITLFFQNFIKNQHSGCKKEQVVAYQHAEPGSQRAGVAPEDIDAKAEDGLKVQNAIEAMITSWETGTIVELD